MQDSTEKGKPKIKSSNGSLQLVFTYRGERIYFTLGMRDTPENRKRAEDKALWIHQDILNERFDESLEKYRSKAQLKLIRPDTAEEVSVRHLWDLYLQYRSAMVSPTTMKNQYAAITSHLRKLPRHTVKDAIAIRDWLLENLTADSARRTLMQLAACCRWAKKSNLVDSNPFAEMPAEIKVKRPSAEDIDPFTKEEQAAILEAFDKTRYGSFVRFLLLTGTRTGEARGLKWKHVGKTTLAIEQSLSPTGDLTDTKTHRPRRFPINKQLAELLQSIRPKKPDPEAAVFDIGSLRTFQDNWERTVSQLVIEGKVERYRPQYNTRHSFITNCVEGGITVPQIVKWVGNSAEIILKHYAGTVRSVHVPEFEYPNEQ